MNYGILSRLHSLIDVLAMFSAAAEKKKVTLKVKLLDQTNFPNLKPNPNR